MTPRHDRAFAALRDSSGNSRAEWSRRDLLRVLSAAGIGALSALETPLTLWSELRPENSFIGARNEFFLSPSGREGAVVFDSSDQQLVAGFRWAKAEALHYAHNAAPVGPWYEAGLPGRHAFCMRDVSHMSDGAHILGLQAQNKNMLGKFAASVAASRDWCGYWEINRENHPAPVDYRDDQHFWFNLPANFDVLNACYQQYLWTDDTDYLKGDFLSFYRHTVADYVRKWEVGSHGLVGSQPGDGTRGLGSYDEALPGIRTGADLVAAQYAAYGSYAEIERHRGEVGRAAEYHRKAQRVKQLFNREWWNNSEQHYFFAVGYDGQFMDLSPAAAGAMMSLPLYFNLVDAGKRTQLTLTELSRYMPLSDAMVPSLRVGLEDRTYLPNIYYRCGWATAGYQALIALTDPRLYRRQYPEVSFTVVGNIATGLMGIGVEPASGDLQTFPQLPPRTNWAVMRHVPVRAHAITVRHDGNGKTSVRNESGPPLRWRACFPVGTGTLLVDGKKASVVEVPREGGTHQRYAVVTIPEGKEVVVTTA